MAVEVDSKAYRHAIAQIVMEAAARSVIPAELRVGRRFKINSMTTTSGATLLVNSLVASDYDRARWLACEPLMPELGICIGHLRRMERAELILAEGEAELRRLREKALARLAERSPESQSVSSG